jgi:hypothetical protein
MAVREAINAALDEEMARDEKVFIIGTLCEILSYLVQIILSIPSDTF